MADDKYFSRTFFLGVLFALLLLTLLIVKPLLTVLFAAAILAYVFYPTYRFLFRKTNSKTLSSWIIVIVLLFVVIIPMFFIANSLTKEGYIVFVTAKQQLDSITTREVIDCAESPAALCELNNRVTTTLKQPEIRGYLENAVSKLSIFLIDKTSSILLELPRVILYLFIMFFTIFHLLIDGPAFLAEAKNSIPLKQHHIDHIIKQFDNFTYATIYGNLITAIIQGTIGGLIFFMLGISAPILAGLAMTFFAFLPFIGTPIIWLPTALGLIFAGELTKGIALLLLGTFVISTIDNIIKPGIIGKRTNLHPLAVLLGIIGGIFAFGLIGIIAGPLIISLALSFIHVYYKEGL